MASVCALVRFKMPLSLLLGAKLSSRSQASTHLARMHERGLTRLPALSSRVSLQQDERRADVIELDEIARLYRQLLTYFVPRARHCDAARSNADVQR
jgi:hypothetical protein